MFTFVKDTSGQLRQEAMNVLKKLHSNKKIRAVTETSKVY